MATEGRAVPTTLLPRFERLNASIAENESDLRRERDDAEDRMDATRLRVERDSFFQKQQKLHVRGQRGDPME